MKELWLGGDWRIFCCKTCLQELSGKCMKMMKSERRSMVGSILHAKSKVVMLGCSNTITCGGLQATFISYNTFSASF
jgi:hypothetical protein